MEISSVLGLVQRACLGPKKNRCNGRLYEETMTKRLVTWMLFLPTLALLSASILWGPAVAQTSEPLAVSQEATPEPTPTRVLDEIVGATRTPMPTATPGVIEQRLYDAATRAGILNARFLGLRVTEWINISISVVIVLAGYLVGTWLIRSVLPRLARRTPYELDQEILEAIGSEVRWLVVVLALGRATNRLGILGVDIKSLLADLYFIAALLLIIRILWRLVNLAEVWYRGVLAESEREDDLGPIVTLAVLVSRVTLVILGISTLLSRFGFNITGIATALGIGGLAISLAARDTIADAIAGFIILVDRPFREGDRIEIQGVGTWGDVVSIGLRTTRIRTRDNRMVIVPNSIIGSNQVINYSFPDPRYRIQTHIGVAYGTDIEMARLVLVDTVKQVEGILLDMPIDALYLEMGDSAMIFRVRWWIPSFVDTRRVEDRVHTALQNALDEAGINSPFPTQSLQVQVDADTLDQVSGMLDTAKLDKRIVVEPPIQEQE
jgi:small-conductance mechanosensitive channel